MHLTTGKVGLPSSSTMVDDKADFSILAGEDLSFSDISGNRDDGLEYLMQRSLHRSCKAVRHLATPCDPDLRTVVGNIASNITADLEARLLITAPFKGHTYNTRSKLGASNPRDTVPANEHLDAYARDILKWAKKQSSMHLGADYVAPLFGSFMLFVAHHIKDHVRRHGEAGLFKPEDCRLILPVANKGIKVERTDIDSADSDSSTDFYTPGYVDPTDFFSVECGMFPLSSSVEKQVVPAPHLVFADAEMVGHPDDYTKAELRLATKTKALFFSQHNRRFAWGLTVSGRTIHAYVFGPDDIWVSTAMDISGIKGRQAFISLLVNWSLCPVDRLGFDPSIRYVVDRCVSSPYLEIDVHELDRSTGRMEQRMYYSQRGPAGDTHESLVLNILNAEFDQSGEFSGSFVQLVSAGPVYINRGNTVVADSTTTAFVGLPSTTQDVAKAGSNVQGSSSSCVRQHRRAVTKWAGNMISEADNQSQVVVAVADTMTALNAAYVKCKILHGHISDRAILLQKTARGVKGILAEFDYASYAGDNDCGVETPELMLFQSIRCLENPRAVRTLLDDCESLFYLVCWLGTFGINQAQRMANAARHAAGLEPCRPIMAWNQGTAADIANNKRAHMDTSLIFTRNILNRMNQGPLRHLAEDSPLRPLVENMYIALFLHPGCYGVTLLTDNSIARIEDGNIRAALLAIPVINGTRNPLILRHAVLVALIANILGSLPQH
ncbi:hypothetical protein GGI03_006914 [Coemansia sp. RSA 2337]|nr:hypothetical protein GGI03_006914 [Coemansia sp. RSA 2337]